MHDGTGTGQPSDADLLNFDISDDALEAAASTGPAFSFPNAPTLSVLVMCCDNGAAR